MGNSLRSSAAKTTIIWLRVGSPRWPDVFKATNDGDSSLPRSLFKLVCQDLSFRHTKTYYILCHPMLNAHPMPSILAIPSSLPTVIFTSRLFLPQPIIL